MNKFATRHLGRPKTKQPSASPRRRPTRTSPPPRPPRIRNPEEEKRFLDMLRPLRSTGVIRHRYAHVPKAAVLAASISSWEAGVYDSTPSWRTPTEAELADALEEARVVAGILKISEIVPEDTIEALVHDMIYLCLEGSDPCSSTSGIDADDECEDDLALAVPDGVVGERSTSTTTVTTNTSPCPAEPSSQAVSANEDAGIGDAFTEGLGLLSRLRELVPDLFTKSAVNEEVVGELRATLGRQVDELQDFVVDLRDGKYGPAVTSGTDVKHFAPRGGTA